MKPEIKITDKYIEVIGHYDDEILCAKMTMLADLYAIERRDGYAKFNNHKKLVETLDDVNNKLIFMVPPPLNYGPFYNYIYVDDVVHTIMSSSTAPKPSDVSILHGVYHDKKLYYILTSYYEPTVEEVIAKGEHIDNISADYTGRYTSADNPFVEDKLYRLGYFENVTVYHTSISASLLNATYGTQKIIDSLEVTPPVDVTYDGSTIVTLNAGDTKTLQCNGKLMASDVTIGEKTLQCNGKLMTSDVLIAVEQ